MTEQQDLDQGEGTETWDPDDPRPWRQHAKQLEKAAKTQETALNEAMAELDRYRKRDTFERVAAEAKIEGVTLEDLSDVPADQITPTLLRVKAEEKQAVREAAELTQAQALGYESVADFRADMERVRSEREANRAELGAASDVALASSAGPPPGPDPKEEGWRSFRAAKEKGLTDEAAMSQFYEALEKAAATSATTGRSAAAAR